MNIRYFSSQQQAITNPGSRLLHSQTIVVEVYLARTVDSRKCEEEKMAGRGRNGDIVTRVM